MIIFFPPSLLKNFHEVALSFWPSILEPFYLILYDLFFINIGKQQGFVPGQPESYFIKDMLTWSWPLLIDSWAANASFAGEIEEDLQKRINSTREYLSQRLFHKSLRVRLPSEDEQLRDDFTKKLNKLAHALYHNAISKEDLKVLYETVTHAKAEIQEKLPDLQGEALENAQGFFTLRYLLAASDQVQEVRQQVKSWYTSITEGIIGFNLLTGAPARLMVFELIVENITNIVPGHPNAIRSGINWSLALAISVVQTVFEAYGMKAFFKNFLAQEDPHGHTLYKGARIPAKIYAGTLALIYTGCLLAITTLQVSNTWKLDPAWMVASIPFLFAEFATQAAVQWGWSTQQEVSLFARIHNLFTRPKILKKSPKTQFKRDELIEQIKTLKDRIPYLHPDAIQMLK